MRYPAAEKLEIIRLVEQSPLPVRRTLDKLGIFPATFYRWYDLLSSGGPEALKIVARPDRIWNRIPDGVRDNLIELALDEPALRRGNWPSASPTRTATSCQRLRSIAC